MNDLCQVIMYFGLTFMNTAIQVDDKPFLFKYMIGYGYTVSGEFGVLIASSEQELIYKFRKIYCADDFMPDSRLVMR